ncbi:MAG: cytochrome c biogenesis protein ResB, partial [Muribaculaceae bacterium]|nr:cytochrome c biogenesis protein ResB [Muribaculaceae bacterium]
MKHQPFTLLLHIALAVILAGAFVTHFLGIQGKLRLHADAAPVSAFEKESGPGNGILPFSVNLDKVEIDYYPATTTPMDFRSVLKVDGHELTVAMNKVGEYHGWRFYQSGISSDSATLSVSHDPWGTGITYAGYILLAIGMLGFFFQRHTAWRALLRKYRRTGPAILLLAASLSVHATETGGSLPAMQRPLASNFGKVLVYWNDRICPMQTLASDVTTTLYGSSSYRGYTPEQILSGWLFYYDRWQRDYMQTHPEQSPKQQALVRWIGTGEIFRIYPYRTGDGHIEWLSL